VGFISAEGFEFVIDRQAAMVSKTLKGMLESSGEMYGQGYAGVLRYSAPLQNMSEPSGMLSFPGSHGVQDTKGMLESSVCWPLTYSPQASSVCGHSAIPRERSRKPSVLGCCLCW